VMYRRLCERQFSAELSSCDLALWEPAGEASAELASVESTLATRP